MIDFREYLSSSPADPKKILKAVISISVLLLVIWLFMVSRMEIAGGSGSDPAVQERADSLRTTLLQPDLSEGNGGRDPGRSTGLFFNAFTTFIILISILAAVWLWVRKKPVFTRQGGYREVGSQILGQGAQLKVIEMNEEIWVLGVTSGSVNLLHRYTKEEWRIQGGHLPASSTGQNEKSGSDSGQSEISGSDPGSRFRSASGRSFRSFYDIFKSKV